MIDRQMQFADMALAPISRATRMKQAHAAADRGIEFVSAKADDLSPGWMDKALESVRKFAGNQGGALFTIETMRWLIERELPTPADLRVWGAVTRLATRRGLIEKTNRSAPTASSNGSDRPLYRKGAKA